MSILANLGAFLNKAPVPYVQRSASADWFQSPQNAKSLTNMEAYGAVGTLFAIVNRLANDTSAQCWKLYMKQKDTRRRYAHTGMDDRKEVIDHMALKLLNKPNPFMTTQLFIEITQQHIDLAGESFWAVVSEYGIPYELWPLRPDRMTIVCDAEEYLTGYVYTTPDGRKIPMETDQIIHLKMPSPVDIYRGASPVSAILPDLESSRLSSEWNRNFFKNSAVPGGVIQVEGRLSDEDFYEMMLRWREQHKGVANAHRAAVLDNGGKWIPTSMTMRDMQFAELREVSSHVIREAFGFPKFKLGDVTDVNRANADASERMYARSLLKPRLERIKQALNTQLLPLFGSTGMGIEFDYDSPEPEDEEMEMQERLNKAQAAKTLVDAGYDPEAVLEVVGLPPMEHKGITPPAPPTIPDGSEDNAELV